MSQPRLSRARGALALVLALCAFVAACGHAANEPTLEAVGGATAPVIESIVRDDGKPLGGMPGGGEEITIKGKNFKKKGLTVLFGSHKGKSPKVVSETEIKVRSPRGMPAGVALPVAIEMRDADKNVTGRAVVPGAWPVGGLSARWGVVLACAIGVFSLLGGPIFVVLASITLLAAYLIEQQKPDFGFIVQEGADGSPSPGKAASSLFEGWLDSTAKSPLFIAIPLFTFAGTLMAESKTPQRLVDLARALIGWLPGGVALAALITCSFFTAFTGASGVTIIALGGLLFPVLLRDRYSERFSLGLITTCGSLGLLFKPSLPVYIYAIIAGVDGDRLFTAALLPGLLLIITLAIYSGVVAIKARIPRARFSGAELWRAFRAAFWELPLIPIVIGGMYSGWLTAAEASAVTAFYAFIAQVFIYRDIKLRDTPRVVKTSMVLVGSILMILGMALGFMDLLTNEKVPQTILELMETKVHDRVTFLLMLNVFLLIVGCVMEGYTATLVVVPLVAPIAKNYGVDPYHLGVIFLLNLEIAYSLPPVGFNLFLSALRFGKPVVSLYKAAMDFVIVMIVALVAVTYVPSLSLFAFEVPGIKAPGKQELKAGELKQLTAEFTLGGVDLPTATARAKEARAALESEEAKQGLKWGDLEARQKDLDAKIAVAKREERAKLAGEMRDLAKKSDPFRALVDKLRDADRLVSALKQLAQTAQWRSNLAPHATQEGAVFKTRYTYLTEDGEEVTEDLPPGDHEITVTAIEGLRKHIAQEKFLVRVTK